MALTWVEDALNEPFAECSLESLVKSIVDAKDPLEGFRHVVKLGGLLLLSNRLRAASTLLAAAYDFSVQCTTETNTPNLSLQIFWQTHAGWPRPEHVPDLPADRLAAARWGKYRECTRTGWMLDSYPALQQEPADPAAVWRTTDDPALLALCARLLAKTVEPGTYPPPDRMREALACARKLYALPETDVAARRATEAAERASGTQPERHSYLVYRRMAVELALRLDEPQTAADILGEGLRRDGLTHAGSVDHYLMLPGIYTCLPLLAAGGSDSNPFYVTEENAEAITSAVLAALKLRATEGRQWELGGDKVGWPELLDRLAKAAWQVHRREYRSMHVWCADDILYDPATEEEIQEAEEKVGELPPDLKDMVRVANGFKGGYHLFGGGIAGIQHIRCYPDPSGYFEPIYEYALEEEGLRQDGEFTGPLIQLEPGVDADGFNHYIIPPAVWKANVVGRDVKEGAYQYWHWAPWQGSIHRWDSIQDYVASCVEEVEEQAARGEVAGSDIESVDSAEVGEDESDESDD